MEPAMRIPSVPSDTTVETLCLTVEDPDLTLDLAREKAKEAAFAHCERPPMLLAWNDAGTGRFHPTHECGKTGEPPWKVYARARGANLTVDVNQGRYVFVFLKL
jgi:hypothetical protein